MFKDKKKMGKIIVIEAVVLYLLSILIDSSLLGILAAVLLVAGIVNIRNVKKEKEPISKKSSPDTGISYNTSPLNRIAEQRNTATTTTTTTSDKPLQRAFIKTYVTGLNYEGRQGIIASWKENMYEPYDGMTTKEMKAENYGIFYKYPKDYETDALTFEPEPTNKYDSNAVKVIHKEMGFIGYIPKEDNVRLLKLLESKVPFYVDSEVYGGQYKDVDDGEMTSNNEPFGISLRIYKNLENSEM